MEKISLYFWQNCISPHQLPYIKELHKDIRINKVYLIAPVSISTERKSMGWGDSDNKEGVEIILSPDINKIESLFKNNQQYSIHLFSGIRADKSVYQYFKISLQFNIKRGIVTEPPFVYKTPILLHKLRFLLFDFKYVSKIDFVFGMGEKAVEYYKFWSKKWQVFLFGYCVQNQANVSDNQIEDQNLRLVFVGSLIKRKNVLQLLKAFNAMSKNNEISLDIIGDGREFRQLNNYVIKQNLSTKISFKGKLSMNEIHSKLSSYDSLILPSVHDGWGAVVNEGLQSGLFIVCSDNCGAKTLIEDSDRGIVFKNKSIKSLAKALEYCYNNMVQIKGGKQKQIYWSDKINGVSMAKYMVDCLTNSEYVIPPWKDNFKI